MPHPSFRRALRRGILPIFLFSLVGLVVAAIITFAQPQKYSADARLLIIQKFSVGLDPYTALKSAEMVAGNLAGMVHTTDFFTKVAAEDENFNRNYFGDNDTKQRKNWEKTIRTSVAPGSGLLTITALHPQKERAAELAQAVSNVLTKRGDEYISGDVEIKLVDVPLVSTSPVEPKIVLNLALGLGLGLLIGVGFVLLSVANREQR